MLKLYHLFYKGEYTLMCRCQYCNYDITQIKMFGSLIRLGYLKSCPKCGTSLDSEEKDNCLAESSVA